MLDQPGAPGSVIAGAGFGFSVTAEDAFGNTVPTYATSPALSLPTSDQPAGEALGGTLTPARVTASSPIRGSRSTRSAAGSRSASRVASWRPRSRAPSRSPLVRRVSSCSTSRGSPVASSPVWASASAWSGRRVREYCPHLRHEPGAIAGDPQSTGRRDPRREPGPERK